MSTLVSLKQAVMASLVAVTLLSNSLFGAGEVNKDGRISTFLEGDLQDVKSVESSLKGAGFEVLATDTIDKKGKLTTVVFTCPSLKKMANKPNRGHAAVLRVLINKIDNEISISNPLYFSKAFLQDDFDEKTSKAVLAKINGAFKNLKDSKDGMQFNELSGYHFMLAMPYYNDMAVVGEGENADLISKAKAYKNGENLLFEVKLSDDRVLLGYKIGKRTAKFVSKIGTKNAGLLPYTILIEKNKARILVGKYYIAINYPELQMSHFMKIATVPGAIEKDCSKAFK